MNRHFWMFLFVMILCAPICAQNYSNEVTLVQQDDNSVTVLATAVADKKKDAGLLAAKSAFHTLFHAGVQGVKNGVPMIAVEKQDYDYRFFTESRYINYIGSEVETVDDVKIGGKYRVTVKLTIRLKTLLADMAHNNLAISPGWTDAKVVKSTAALNPTIVIVPDMLNGGDFEAMRSVIQQDRVMRYVIDKLSNEFQHNGYKTNDFISQLQNSKNSSLLRLDAQSDAGTKIVQMLPGDIVVNVEVKVNTNAKKQSECSLNLRAIENQTSGKLATIPFTSGQYMTTDSLKLADYALKQIKKDFFETLRGSFEAMIMKGREVNVDMNLSKAVSDWDFEQESPVSGNYFKDALDEWLRANAYQGVYDMSNNTDKFIHIRLNVPLWNQERNRSYTLSNFGSDLKKFFKAELGDNYKASVTAMGQKLEIIIE